MVGTADSVLSREASLIQVSTGSTVYIRISVPTAVLLYKCFIVIQCRLSILAMNLLYHMSRGNACAAERMKQLASERYVSELLIVSG